MAIELIKLLVQIGLATAICYLGYKLSAFRAANEKKIEVCLKIYDELICAFNNEEEFIRSAEKTGRKDEVVKLVFSGTRH